MRGQGYDGASNMSSSTVGVQARIKKEAPLATYVHCNGHCLNLVISKSCALPQVRNVLDRLKNCCRFFLKSPKRSGLLELIVKHNVVNETKRKPLLDLCKTRWAERHTAYQHFYQAFVFIAEALEMIGFKRHLDKYGDMYADWDPANRNEAQQILASITSFEFIVVFMAVYQYLSHLAGITVKLQRAALDIVEAHGMITEVASFYRKQREDCDKTFSAVYTQSVAMAEKVGTAAEMPRITSRQQHRSNTEAQNPKIYFQRNVAIPLLDHIIMCINEQFSPSATVAASLLGLVPSVLCSKNVNLEAAVNKYNDDLPSPEMFEMELMRWRGRYLAMEPELRPASPAVAIKDCDDDLFPNISILLKIACTIPVTSCECERSASTLRRLNYYMRASMGKERLSNLALLHIHYDTPVELDTVVNCYAHLHPRRLQLENLLQ
ncbi:52 kDa repressor of the inhibitor of the protein kinase-like [Oculina patagonica]